ncbi:MAG: hypothetical protein R3F61_10810 [Myxococcota bacterium]
MRRIGAALTAGALVAACGEPCGESRYWVYGDDYVTRYETCSSIGGSFGLSYANAPYTIFLLDGSSGDVSSSTSFALDYTPATRIVFGTDHLVSGEVMDMRHLGGTGFHDPTGTGQLPVEKPLTFGVIEVLDGPRERGDRVEYELDWDLTIGELAEPHQGGFQRHVGTTWIHFDTHPSFWEEGVDTPPPDAG